MVDERLPKSVRLIVSPMAFKEMGGPPPPFLPLMGDGIVHPTKITLMYGRGGIGKGWVACYIARALRDEGRRVLIVDVEGQEYEWTTRLYGMGVRFGDEIWYCNPGPLNREVARQIGEHETDYIILDSASAARKSLTDNDQGGADAANALFANIVSIGLPALVIAHEAKAGKGPIGSVQYTNVPRLVYRAEAEGMDTVLHMEKVNDRPMEDKPLTFSRAITPGGVDVIRDYREVVRESKQPEKESVSQAILKLLKDRDRSLDADEIQRYLDDLGHEVSMTSLRAILSRFVRDGKVIRPTKGKYAWPIDQTDIT
jgi:Fe2+ transport system protein FeoA